jgi:hypothetical protein
MALTNAEKVKRYRERQKALKQAELLKPTPPTEVFKKPFFEFFTTEDRIGGAYSQCLELAGFVPVPFDDDTGPEVSTLDDLSDPKEEGGFSNPFGDSKGSSLGKAEIIVALLLDAATDLAGWVNDYKKSEIKARLAEIEASEWPDAGSKRMAFAKVAELNKMLRDLDKEVRVPIPRWKVDVHDELLKE